MNKHKIFMATIAVGFGVAFGWLLFQQVDGSSSQPIGDEETTQQAEDTTAIESENEGRTFVYGGEVGESAFDTLSKITKVESESSEFGEYVTAINGVKADSNSEFWAFYVNGEQAAVGADTYIAEEGDEFTWILESF